MKIVTRLNLAALLFAWLAIHHVAIAEDEAEAKQFVKADSIDIDGNGEFDALTDGLLLLRSMFDLSDSPLIANVVGTNAVYASAEEIEFRISSMETQLDIDNDGRVDALTDGLLILRYLFRFSGESLVSDALSSDAQRTAPEEIRSYLDNLATNNITFNSSKIFSIPENQKQVGTVSVADTVGRFVSYSLVGSDTSSLSINSITGALFFNQPPDFELKSSYEVVAKVTDGINSNVQTIRISVTNVDDVAPVFTSASVFVVPENQTGIGSVTAEDLDSDLILYSITGEDITISTDGALSFSSSPDFEQKNSYSAIITASDGTNQSQQAVTISITDVNDVAPVITSRASFVKVVTADAGPVIGTVTATDVDSNSLSFSIDSNELFISDNGLLSYSPDLDQSADKIYSGIVSVTDGSFAVTQSITVSAEYDTDGDGAADTRDPDDDNDGAPDNTDDFPKDPLESVDTDDDGIGNNTDTDDDNDGVLDVVDEYPLDAGNVIDSDSDGVVDRNDVFPNDPNQQKSLSIDFADAASLGLGEVIDDGGSTTTLNLLNPREKDRSAVTKLLDFFISKAWANPITLSSLTNIINWDVDGSEVLDTILSNQTVFVAGADVTPDGEYIYLLTSAHIQRAIPNLDREFCSIYRVQLDNYAFECLLNTDDGDIQPRSLNPSITLDFSRGNIAFRSDGTALLHGFNWKQLAEDPLSNGVALGSVWIMSPKGVLTPIPKEDGFEVNLAVWVNDDYFASHEWFFDGENLSQERIAIYEASTLERVKLVEANGASQGVIKFNGDLYWSGGSLDGVSLETQDNPVPGLPIVDSAGKRLYGFTNSNDPSNKIVSADGSIVLDLTDGVGGVGGYNYQKQSGVGTDIKYSAFNFTDQYIGYMKIFAPETPIVSIDGNAFGADQVIAISDDRGQLEIQNYRDIFLITPSATLVGDLVIDYVVDVNGVNETRQMLIDEQTIQNWRDDENSGDWLEWASPESEQEGFCIYAIEAGVNQCVKFEDYTVLTTDMESFRSTRYDANPVYPNGTGNAFPGIQSVLFTGDDLRVYFKDSDDHQYYEAAANLDDFIARGGAALSFSSAENGSGESNIIAQGTSLKPTPMKEMEVTVTETAPRELTINFAQALSAHAPLPSFEVSNGMQAIPLAEKIQWSEARDTAIIRATSVGWTGGLENEVRVLDPMFIVNSNQRYKPASTLTFISNNTNDNTPEFQSSGDFSVEENRRDIGVVEATDADGDLVNYQLSDGDADLLRIDVGSGELTFNELSDFELKASYNATVTATDGIKSSTQAVSIKVLDVDDEAPIFTSPEAFSVPENQNAIGDVTATDIDSDPISISFSIDDDALAITADGVLSFITAPDYETRDSYSGIVTATDGINSATMEVTIAIEDVDDPPVITSSASFATTEDQTAVGAVTATDVDSEVLVFSLESDQLNITPDGVLSFINAPDFQVQTNYEATVKVTDGINTVDQDITIRNSAGPDDDGDGIFDVKELAFGLDPLDATDALLDPDEDGFNNVEEANSNSNPFDPDSVPSAGTLGFTTNNTGIEEGAGSVEIKVHRILGAAGTVSVDFSVFGTGRAIENEDFSTTSGTLTWGPGDVSIKSFNVPIVNDNEIEASELVRLKLSNPNGGAKLGMQDAILSIYDDDFVPDGQPLNGGFLLDYSQQVSEAAGTVEIEVLRLGGSEGQVSVDVLVAPTNSSIDRHAARDSDFSQPLVSKLVWQDGDRAKKSIHVPIIDDAEAEQTELFFVSLENPTGGSVVYEESPSDVNIIDDDSSNAAGIVGLAHRSFRFDEAEEQVDVTLVRNQGSEGEVSVDLSVLGNSAVEGEDYPAFAQTVTWQTGDDQPKTITIPYFDDTEAEPLEFFLLLLSNVQGDAVLDRQTQSNPDLSIGLALAFDYSDIDLVLDTDSDGVVNVADRDDDNDGVRDVVDAFPLDASEQLDSDGDGVGDNADALPLDANETLDTDADGIGNNADTDDDGDGVNDENDAFPLDAPETFKFAYTFDASQLGTSGHVLMGFVAGNLLPDGDTIVIQDFLSASLAANPYLFTEDAGIRAFDPLDTPKMSLSGAKIDFWVCPQGFTSTTNGAGDCSFGDEGGFLFSDDFEFNRENLVGPLGWARAGIPEIEQLSDGSNQYRDEDIPINIANWSAAKAAAGDFVAADFDADGILDVKELALGLDPLDATDALLDPDDDGFNNVEEANSNSDPFDPDSVPSAGTLEFTTGNTGVEEGTSSAEIRVHRVLGAAGTVSVDFSVFGTGRAIENEDFSTTNGTLTWGPGDVSIKSFNVPIVSDNEIEAFELVRLKLSNPNGGAKLGMRDAILSIFDDDFAPDGQPLNGGFLLDYSQRVSEAAGTVEIEVMRLGGSEGQVSVDVLVAPTNSSIDRHAALDSDFSQPLVSTLVWQDGDRAKKSIHVPIIDDAEAEQTELFFVSLENPTGGSVVYEESPSDVNIVDDDSSNAAGIVGLAHRSFRFDEAEEQVDVTLVRNQGSEGEVSVDLSVLAGSAVEGEDYATFAQTITWQADDDQPKTVTIPYLNDTAAEPIEYFLLVLSNVQGDAVLDRQTQSNPSQSAGLAIAFDYSDIDLVLDTDSDGVVNVADRDDDNDGVRDVVDAFPLDASEQLDSDGDGVGDNADAFPIDKNEQFDTDGDGVGDNADALPLDANETLDTDADGIGNNADTDDDGDGIFDVKELAFGLDPLDATDALLDPDDDGFNNVEEANSNSDPFDPDSVPSAGTLEFTTGNTGVEEGTSSAEIRVHRVLGAAGTVSVDFSVFGTGRAIENEDFSTTNGTLTWGPGDVSIKSFNVPIVSDNEIEAFELVRLKLSNPNGGAKLGMRDAILSIFDDDFAPDGQPLNGGFLLDYSQRVSEAAGTVEIEVMRLGGSEGQVSVDVLVAPTNSSIDRHAALDSDFSQPLVSTLVWQDGDRAKKSIHVPIIDDAEAEQTELFFVSLENPTGGSVVYEESPSDVNIVDDDSSNAAGIVGLAHRSFRFDEAEEQVDVTLVRNQGSEGEVSVDLSVLAGSAVEGEDYATFAQTITWQADDDQPKTVTIPYLNDTAAEPIEYFLLVLSNVQGDAVLDRQTQSNPGQSAGLAIAFDYSDIDLVLDTDSDGVVNVADRDDDNDGVRDVVDAFPLDAPETFKFAYTFDASQLGTPGHVLMGFVAGNLLPDGDTIVIQDFLSASLAANPYLFTEDAGIRAFDPLDTPKMSLSGAKIDFWVCPQGFTSTTNGAGDCSFGDEGGFLFSDDFEFNRENLVGSLGWARAGIPEIEQLSDGSNRYRDEDIPINIANWSAAKAVTSDFVAEDE